MTTWTDEVAGTARVLKREDSGEGAVVWHAKKGVWRADFVISGGENPVTQSKIFDLRNASGTGLVFMLR